MCNKLTVEQKHALWVLENEKNVFLSGNAGTGKSHVISEYIARNKDKKRILVCAPTGMAATNIGGVTLHRMFKVPFKNIEPGSYNYFSSDDINLADVIIIDEISMCRIDLFEYVMETIVQAEIKSCIHKQVIVVGDFYQLPPVITKAEKASLYSTWCITDQNCGFAFWSHKWNRMNFEPIILKEVVRQGDTPDNLAFKENLNKIRIGDPSGIQWFNNHLCQEPFQDALYLCSRNDEAQKYNDFRISELLSEERFYLAKSCGRISENETPTSRTLLLKIGMRVMTLVNNDSAGYMNGSTGIITGLEDNHVSVELDSGASVKVSRFRWTISNEYTRKTVLGAEYGTWFEQFPLKPAYAVSIHKSQGQTFDKVNLNPDCWGYGMLYVALSRVKDINCLRLTKPISWEYLKTSDWVRSFYAMLEQPSEIDVFC